MNYVYIFMQVYIFFPCLLILYCLFCSGFWINFNSKRIQGKVWLLCSKLLLLQFQNSFPNLCVNVSKSLQVVQVIIKNVIMPLLHCCCFLNKRVMGVMGLLFRLTNLTKCILCLYASIFFPFRLQVVAPGVISLIR